VYSPRGSGVVSEGSRRLRARVKAGDAEWLAKYAARVHDEAVTRATFSGFFNKEVILVPVPNSAPANRVLWVARRLAVALKTTGLAGTVWEGLYRLFPVEKSATAPAGRRPTVREHYESFAVDQAAPVPGRIVLIDDVVTKGRTLLAAAMRLHEAFPQAQIRAFALVRTMGRVREVQHLLEPCRGEIRWVRADACRDP
jgi:predicted amidophosphoribosyltransferase